MTSDRLDDNGQYRAYGAPVSWNEFRNHDKVMLVAEYNVVNDLDLVPTVD